MRLRKKIALMAIILIAFTIVWYGVELYYKTVYGHYPLVVEWYLFTNPMRLFFRWKYLSLPLLAAEMLLAVVGMFLIIRVGFYEVSKQ